MRPPIINCPFYNEKEYEDEDESNYVSDDEDTTSYRYERNDEASSALTLEANVTAAAAQLAVMHDCESDAALAWALQEMLDEMGANATDETLARLFQTNSNSNSNVEGHAIYNAGADAEPNEPQESTVDIKCVVHSDDTKEIVEWSPTLLDESASCQSYSLADSSNCILDDGSESWATVTSPAICDEEPRDWELLSDVESVASFDSRCFTYADALRSKSKDPDSARPKIASGRYHLPVLSTVVEGILLAIDEKDSLMNSVLDQSMSRGKEMGHRGRKQSVGPNGKHRWKRY